MRNINIPPYQSASTGVRTRVALLKSHRAIIKYNKMLSDRSSDCIYLLKNRVSYQVRAARRQGGPAQCGNLSSLCKNLVFTDMSVSVLGDTFLFPFYYFAVHRKGYCWWIVEFERIIQNFTLHKNTKVFV